MMPLNPALFLDRDGVINENRANYVRCWDDVVIYPQVLTALAQIASLSYKIIVITNQSAVGRDLISRETAVAINEQLVATVENAGGRIDAVYMCPHAPQDHCNCRKPKPGMLLQAASEHNIDFGRSLLIGDALTDLGAGRAVGIPTLVLLRTGRGLDQAQQPEAAKFAPLTIYNNLSTALADLLLPMQ